MGHPCGQNKPRQRAVVLLSVLFLLFFNLVLPEWSAQGREQKMITLPEPAHHGKISVEAALQARVSTRTYAAGPLTLNQVSQLLWAAQGITSQSLRRTAPSAGALYPLEVYLVAGHVQGLAPGIYHYLPQAHGLELVLSGDRRKELAIAALGQGSIENGAVNLVLAGVYGRTAAKYGSRARRYVHMEIGHAAQNIYLQAVALKLGTVAVGAFDDEQVQQILGMEKDEAPLCIMPVGRQR